jgi:O-antigen ligase
MAWRRIIRSIGQHGSLRDLARWLFLATLVLAPWLYGGTTAWSIEIINGLLGLVLVLWVASLIVERRWPVLPRGLVIIAAIILLQGWWMVANASAIYDSTFRYFVALGPISSAMPGSADYVLSFAWMLRATVLLGVVCVTAELSERPVWLLRLWSAIVVAGGSIALFGLLQKGTGAKMIFWSPDAGLFANNFFASFFYHANAGAFLNLVLPVTAGFVLWIVARQSSPWARSASVTALVLVGVAVLSNTSRMAQAVAAVLVVAMIAAIARPALRVVARAEKRTVLLGLVVLVVTVIAVAQAAHLDRPIHRWQQIRTQLPQDARWAADRVALDAIGDASWFGFGPGTFQAIFPHYQREFGNGLRGTWRFLHEDYLQTILEWGWLGSAAIAALFFGGIAAALRNYFKSRDWNNRQRILLLCVVIALAGIALHALVDFPLQILSLQLLVATYLGICWGSVCWKVGRRK